MAAKKQRIKIRDLRALAKRYNKLHKINRKLYFANVHNPRPLGGWWFDDERTGHMWRLGDHVSDSYYVLEEHIAEYLMSVGPDER